jgi:TRAP-type C4-dicarboxylate transport system permease small subunit
MMALFAFFMCYEVFIRYVFGIAHNWGDEVILAGIVGGLMLAAAVIMRTESHTRIDFLILKLHGRKRFVVELVLSALTFAFCVFLLISAINMVQTLIKLGFLMPSTLEVPQWVYWMPFLVGMAACVLFSLEKVIERVQSLLKSQ